MPLDLNKYVHGDTMDISKLESISKIVAAVFIPLAIAYMGNGLSEANKQKDTESKLVELATNILAKEVSPNASSDTKSVRKWAVDVINTYSGVKMESATQDALVNTVHLPIRVKNPAEESGQWGVVFGADKTPAEAEWEIRKASNKFNVHGAQIFLRDGSYRSVAVYNTKNDAEEALVKLKALRADSFIVDMSKWCPSTVKTTNIYLECKFIQ